MKKCPSVAYAVSLLTVLLVAACAGKKTNSIPEPAAPGIVYAYFTDNPPMLVSTRHPDSLLPYIKGGDNLLFTKLYPVTDTLPEITNDPFILADALERLGYEQTSGGSGNFEKGLRMRNRVYENDSLHCSIYKAYQYHQLQADSTYNLLVFEQLVCEHK